MFVCPSFPLSLSIWKWLKRGCISGGKLGHHPGLNTCTLPTESLTELYFQCYDSFTCEHRYTCTFIADYFLGTFHKNKLSYTMLEIHVKGSSCILTWAVLESYLMWNVLSVVPYGLWLTPSLCGSLTLDGIPKSWTFCLVCFDWPSSAYWSRFPELAQIKTSGAKGSGLRYPMQWRGR